MMKILSDTRFASAGRSPREAIEYDFKELSGDQSTMYFNYFPLPLLILNDNRQAVFFNRAFVELVGEGNELGTLGKRPGEFMNCMYSDREPEGCGTGSHCSQCGALLAVQESISEHKKSTRDTQLLQEIGGEINAMDIRVESTPFEFKGTTYYVVTLMDIGNEKRREVMERVFFHDILNTAGSAHSLVRVLCAEGGHDLDEPLGLLDTALFGLVEEIQTHKEFRLAEQGEYKVFPVTIQSREMVETIAGEFGAHIVAERKTIEVLPDSENMALQSDYALLRRVLINMLKNALEATPLNGIVRIGCWSEGEEVVFEVRNEGVIPPSVQLQLFKRSFSTKGVGRGLGTYSIRMLTENYLAGTVEFESDEDRGTVFRVRLPAA